MDKRAEIRSQQMEQLFTYINVLEEALRCVKFHANETNDVFIVETAEEALNYGKEAE